MITFTVKDLKATLQGLAKVVSKKASLPAWRCLRVDATPGGITLTGANSDLSAKVRIPSAQSETKESFLIPFAAVQKAVDALPSRSHITLQEGEIGTERGTENVFSLPLTSFPEEPEFAAKPVPMPDTFSRRFTETMRCVSNDPTRVVLNGTLLDISGASDSGHYLVATDGRHLFSANSFVLPLSESLVVPVHKLLLWSGLPDQWALAAERSDKAMRLRIVAGDWTLTTRTIDGSYPNWRQVVVHSHQIQTRITLSEDIDLPGILRGLPGGDLKDKPVDLVIEAGTVSLKDTVGGKSVFLERVTPTGPDLTIRLNRDYLAKAFAFGLTHVGFIDAMSPMRFSREGRSMTVMPLRVADHPTPTQPAPPEPQPERKTMPENIGHTNGASRSTTPVIPADKPALEAAIDKLDAFKSSFRETLAGLNELSTQLRQALRDQKAGEKEVHNVRQTLRSLQSVKI